jgi:glycosyltransferase involved in cell wall biosynthesis/Flp pilus assembly protein TadD
MEFHLGELTTSDAIMSSTAGPIPARVPLSRARIAELRVQCQKDPNAIAPHREAVDVFLDAGLITEALPLLRRLVQMCPDDARTAAQLGAVLTELGEREDALAAYRRAAALQPDSDRAQLDLVMAACGAGDAVTAREACAQRLRLDPNNYEALNDLGLLETAVGNHVAAAAAYERGLSVEPGYKKGRDNALQFYWDTEQYSAGRTLAGRLRALVDSDPDLVAWQRRFDQAGSGVRSDAGETATATIKSAAPGTIVTNRRIAFVAAADTFLKPIIAHLAAHNHVRVVAPQSTPQLAETMRWAELTWFEWCDGYVVEGTRLPKAGKIVCRLHSYEAFTDVPAKVNWRNVDCLILVNRSVEEILDQHARVPVRRRIIHNGVDPHRFPFVPPSRRTPGERNVASVGYINYKKNPALLLQIFKVLHTADPAFRLHVAGTHQDPRIKVYFDHLLPRLQIPVEFHGWVDDMPAFYADMNYVISTSLFESFHYSIAEGMLSGCLPLVHSWKGAEGLYPAECLFDTPAEALEMVRRYEAGDADQIAAGYRQFISDRYNWDDRLREIETLLAEVLAEDRPRGAVSTVEKCAVEATKSQGRLHEEHEQTRNSHLVNP